MKIILKNILSNILSNKRRTAILIICMTVVGFSAMLSFSLSGSVKGMLNDYLTIEFGDSKITASPDEPTDEELELPEGCKGFYTVYSSFHIQTRSADNFIYAMKRTYSLIGMDIDAAQEQNFLRSSEPMTLGENDIIITEQLAKKAELSVGSTIDILTPDNEPLTMTVKYVLPNERYLKMRGAAAIGKPDLAKRINGSDNWSSCNISVPDNMSVAEVCEQLGAKYPSMEFINIVEENENAFQSVSIIFMLIFIILALIIFLVAAGISEHMVRERMSQLGTLRSIGATRSSASLILISENLFYGLTGAVIGILLYIPIGSMALSSFSILSISDLKMSFSIKPSTVITVLLVTVLISCASALKAVVKAAKTPIRDIIFGGKDTAYVLKRGKGITGIILVIVGIILGCFVENALTAILGIILVTVGGIFFIPMLLSIIKNASGRTSNPILRLSFNSIATKKTVVSSTILYATIMSLVCSVLMSVSYLDQDFASTAYNADMIITDLSMTSPNYRFISALDGVSDTMLHYERGNSVKLNDEALGYGAFVTGYEGGNTMFKGISGLPDSLADDEISIDALYMQRFGIREGDRVNVTFNSDGERPIELELTAVKGCDSKANTGGNHNNVVISRELYKRYFFDYPNLMLIRLDDPAKADETVNTIRTYLMDKNARVFTFSDYIYSRSSGSEGIFLVLYLIIAIGSLLSLITLATNQSIGFEQRRKELAVLHSTSMSKAQLRKLLMSENLLSILVSTVWAFVFGILYYIMLMNCIDSMNGIKAPYPINAVVPLILMAAMFGASAVLSLINGKRINRMNTAAEMKYE